MFQNFDLFQKWFCDIGPAFLEFVKEQFTMINSY